jgi:hypothetical protein
MKKLLLTLSFFLSALIMNAQIPNAGFENWTFPNNDTVPEGWSSSGFGAGRSSASQSGNYSAYVWNWYYYAKGWIVNGQAGAGFTMYNASSGGTPITEKPLKLHGYYFYVKGDNGSFDDSAFVNIIVKKFNTSLQQPDTVALGRLHLAPASSFIPFTVDIEDIAPGIDPDSIVISFWSCFDNNCFCDVSGAGNCLFFYVDDLSLELASGIISIDDWYKGFAVYPNIISGKATIRIPDAAVNEVQLSLYNSTGQCIKSWNTLPRTEIEFTRENIDAGFYFLQAKSGNTIIGTKKLMLN